MNSLRVFFFAQDLVSHAATSDFDQPLQILDACDYLRLCDWQFSSHISASSHSTSCSALALQANCTLSAWQVKQNICNIMCFKLVLTCVLYQICVNSRLLGMRVQNNRLYAFLACIFDDNSHMCPTCTRMKQSGLTLSRQIRSNEAAVRFLVV